MTALEVRNEDCEVDLFGDFEIKGAKVNINPTAGVATTSVTYTDMSKVQLVNVVQSTLEG